MRIHSSPVVVVGSKRPCTSGWHRHAAEGTFPHVRSSQNGCLLARSDLCQCQCCKIVAQRWRHDGKFSGSELRPDARLSRTNRACSTKQKDRPKAPRLSTAAFHQQDHRQIVRPKGKVGRATASLRGQRDSINTHSKTLEGDQGVLRSDELSLHEHFTERS
jgi:hypothetical protein